MASTYSPDLRIELIGTGDQAGNWGSTTNTNLGTLIEKAIVGVAAVSVVATPQALTAANGLADQARQATLVLTTTTTANFSVLAPPTPKQYVVYNNTAYIATLGNATAVNGTTPTGGSTVTVAAGKIASLWTDGTNFFGQNTVAGDVTLAGVQTLTNKTIAFADNTLTGVAALELLQNSRSAAYTLVLSDSGKHVLHPSADTTARIFTIPANSSVAWPVGTAVTFVNQASAGVVTIAITTDTMRLAGPGTTGSRTLAANGIATALKITSTEWIISGSGLT